MKIQRFITITLCIGSLFACVPQDDTYTDDPSVLAPDEISAPDNAEEMLKAVLDADDLSEVQIVKNPETGRTELSLTLTEDAARRLQELTQQHNGETLAVVVDGRVIMTPTIREPLQGRKLVITASSAEELQEIYQHLLH